MPDARGYIFGADVFGESPDALRRRHPPASVRGPGEHAWWFLSQSKFQRKAAGWGASRCADRRVETGGFWRVEQCKKRLELSDSDAADGFKNCFGFYVGPSKKGDKTPWLMQEFISANDDGAGKRGVPALYRVYVTPKATDDQLRDVFGEDGVKMGPDGKKRPVRAMVSEECFDAIAALLPPRRVPGGVGQEHVQVPPPPPMASADFLDCYSQQGQYQRQHGPFSAAASPLPPPASPGLLGEIAGDSASDNLRKLTAEFWG